MSEPLRENVKLFTCPTCQALLFFENTHCISCGSRLLYRPDAATFAVIDTSARGIEDPALVVSVATGERYRLCGNYTQHDACNWGVPEADPEPFCRACRLNAMIPNLSDAAAKEGWRHIERAKRRLVYTLMGLGLPVESKAERPAGGLAFSFKQDENGGQVKVLTGHDDGLITLNIAEADSPFRERTRVELGEPYRTLVGHFRHEIGHYYWDQLVAGTSWLTPFRQEFGDEREDYEAACRRHYEGGAPPDWPSHFVSAYSSTHPWEDWAETWAHYLHMIDTLETARSFGLALRMRTAGNAPQTMTSQRLNFDDFDDLLTAWFPLTVAINSLNRGMGIPDMYPFVLSDRAIEKLRFVHRVIESTRHDEEEVPPLLQRLTIL